jgi:hypothetical protein
VATNISAKLLLEDDIWIGLGMDGTPHPAAREFKRRNKTAKPRFHQQWLVAGATRRSGRAAAPVQVIRQPALASAADPVQW